MSVIIFPKFSRGDSAADVRDAIGVYSTTEVDNLLSGLGGLTSEDIDTLAEINAILTDANLASIAYVDGLAANYATAAQGALADSALQPSDIASGTITARADDVNLSGGTDGDVLTVQADGSLALETPVAGGGAEEVSDLTETIAVTMGDGEPTPATTIFNTTWETDNGGWTVTESSRTTQMPRTGSYSLDIPLTGNHIRTLISRTFTLTNSGVLTFYRRRTNHYTWFQFDVNRNGGLIQRFTGPSSSGTFGDHSQWILTTINLPAGETTLTITLGGDNDNNNSSRVYLDDFMLIQNGGTPTVFKFNGSSKENLLLLPGVDYKFDQSDASNVSLLKFSNKKNNIGGTEHTAGITTTGTTGADGVVSFNVPYNAPARLYPFATGSSVAGNDSSFVVGYASPTDFGLIDVISGSTGLVDNAILRADGTGGGTAQSCGVTVSDNNEISVVAGTAASVPLTVQGAASQTANLQEWENSSGSVLASMSSNGSLLCEELFMYNGANSIANLKTNRHVFAIRRTGSTNFTFHQGNAFQGSMGFISTAGRGIFWSANAVDTAQVAGVKYYTDGIHVENAAGVDGDLTAAKLTLTNLPTSDPAVAGAIWNDGGTLKVSAG